MRQTNDSHPKSLGDGAFGVGQYVKLSAPGTHLLQVGLQLFEEVIARSDDYDGHLRINQCERSMLKLPCRITFGMHIGDFLELKRAFQRDGIVHTPAEEQRVSLSGQISRPCCNSAFNLQYIC